MNDGTEKYDRLIELAAMLSRQTEFDEVLRVISQKTAFLLKAEAAIVMLINPQTRQTVKTIFREGAEQDR
ncbi:MAG: hypothetical protein KDI38_28075, partial [Calditrichaeota bacterium]|nr:hypothetical protein [Calditrichota bacterium]